MVSEPRSGSTGDGHDQGGIVNPFQNGGGHIRPQQNANQHKRVRSYACLTVCTRSVLNSLLGEGGAVQNARWASGAASTTCPQRKRGVHTSTTTELQLGTIYSSERLHTDERTAVGFYWGRP